jgi:putative methyltransferase (TIGR04325 family)
MIRDVRHVFRQIIPPVVLDIGRRLCRPPRAFATYSEAASACSPGAYNSQVVAEIVATKTSHLRTRENFEITPRSLTVAAAALLAAQGKAAINVLDFGGAAGAHYFTTSQLVEVPLRWCVVETPAMVDAARRHVHATGLSFATTIAAAQEACDGVPDLVLSSGTLQYLPSPIDTLRELIAVGSRFLCLTRTEIGHPPRITIQRSRLSENGPGPLPPGFADGEISYPRTTLDGTTIEGELRKHYVVSAWTEEQTESGEMRGYLGQPTGRAV